MNTQAWEASSGIPPNLLWGVLVVIVVALTLLMLSNVLLSLFDRVVWRGMDGQRALRYGLRAAAVTFVLLLIFR